MQQKNYQQEILALIHSGLPQAELAEKLSDYHENDLADALAALTPDERQKLYAVLGVDTVAEIFSYLDDAEPYLKELPSEKAANVVPTWTRTTPWTLWTTSRKRIKPRSSASWTKTPPKM
jgi:magnesium transporter